MKVSAVLFDLDDTLINTSSVVFPARERAFKAMVEAGLNPKEISDPEKLLGRITSLFGSTPYKLIFEVIILELTNQISSEDYARILTEGIKCYEENMESLAPFPDVTVTLEKLISGGIKVGLISNGLEEIQLEKIEKCGLDRFFNEKNTAISSHFGNRWNKPAPYLFEYMAENLCVSLASSIYVGNQDVDIVGANISGMISILFQDEQTLQYKSKSYNRGDFALKLEKPDFTINRISQVLGVVTQLEAYREL